MADETTEEFFRKADEERERREVCIQNSHPCCDIARVSGDKYRILREGVEEMARNIGTAQWYREKAKELLEEVKK